MHLVSRNHLHIGPVDIPVPTVVAPYRFPTVSEMTHSEYLTQRARVLAVDGPLSHCESPHVLFDFRETA